MSTTSHFLNMHSLYTDGSHANELNIAGIGGYVLDDSQKEVWKFSNPIYDDMVYHELKALQYALVRCLDSNIQDLMCYTDELNIVRELKRGNKKEQVDRRSILFNNVVELLPEFKNIDFQYIPREQNKKANDLARKILTTITSKTPRVEIFQKLNGDANYFKANNLFCLEQFVDKKKISTMKSDIQNHYVFELYRGEYDNTLDVYHINKAMKVSKIYSYIITDTIPQYINAIKQTLDQCDYPSVALMLCPANNEVDLVLRGMKAPNINHSYELDSLKAILPKFKRVLIDNDSLIYQHVFIDLKS